MGLRLAVLISGRGSNLQALIDACEEPGFPASIELVISNRPGVAGLARAERSGLNVAVVDHRNFAHRRGFEEELGEHLRELNVQLVCLAGFMRVLTDEFVNNWKNRLINIHPSLLPAFPGMGVHEQALAAGVRISGCTVHFVRAKVDSGPIILQAVVPVDAADTSDTLAARVLQAEHKCYPQAVRLIAEDRVRIEGNRTVIAGGGGLLWPPDVVMI